MKKKILFLAIIAALVCGFSASAQRTNECNADRTAAGQNDKMYRPQKFTDYAFEGILLTMPQQARVDSLNAAYRALAQQKCNADSAAHCRNHKVKASDHRRPDYARMEQCRKDYIAKVKEILTPEQYTTFLENIVNMPRPEGRYSGIRHGDKDKSLSKSDGKYRKYDKDSKQDKKQEKKQEKSKDTKKKAK